jgi:integration host factor subunit beta
MATITKKELIERIAGGATAKRPEVRKLIQLFLDIMTDELAAGNRLEFRGFGVFEVRERAARTAQNPKTLEPVPVPPRRSVRFRAGRTLCDRLEKGAVRVSVEVKAPRRGAGAAV